MRKNRKVSALMLSSLCLLSLGTSLVTSCGDNRVEGTISGVNDAPQYELQLGFDDFVTDFDTTHFTGYLTRVVNGQEVFATAKGRGVVKSGEKLGLYIYGATDEYTPGVTVAKQNEKGEYVQCDDFVVSSSGELTCPTVTERQDYRIYVIASKTDGDVVSRIRKAIDVAVVPAEQFASSASFDYSGLPGAEREAMSGQIEKYLLNNGLGPVTTYNTGGYQLINERIHTPFLAKNHYVPGYGYGILTYGKINADLSGEHTQAYKRFLHQLQDANQDQANFNYLNSNSAAVADFYQYISSSWFNQYVNKDETGVEYTTGLSRNKAPEAVNPDENGASNKWKVYLRVGGQTDGPNGVLKGLNYRTASTNSKLAAFNNRPITLDDYLTTFKLLATQSIGWFRGAEQSEESTANRQLKGFNEFYKSTANATSLPSNEEFSKKVGVSIDKTDNSITLEFNGKISPEYAEYQLNGVWCNPIPEEFLTTLGGGNVIKGAKLMGISATLDNQQLSPLDTMLSVGPYYTVAYENKKTAAFARNTDWPAVMCKDDHGRPLYQIEGVHVTISNAVSQNKNAYFDKFMNNEIDSSNIPDEKWNEFVNDPRKKEVKGDSLSSFFLNTWDKVFWDEFTKDKSTQWDVKPMLANNNFYKGLIVGIDRVAMTDKNHKVPDFTIQEPENKISPKASSPYNATQSHEQAVLEAFGGTLSNEQLVNWKYFAADYFETAIPEELEAGHYYLGTAAQPTEVTLEIASIEGNAFLNDQLNFVFTSWKEAFDIAVRSHTNEKGEFEWTDGDKPLIVLNPTIVPIRNSDAMQNDVIYNGVKVGKFDGQSIFYVSGNGYDVLNNFDKYRSDDHGGFTLNFGLDTGVPSQDIFYQGKYWSFNALWDAGNLGVTLDEGGRAVK